MSALRRRWAQLMPGHSELGERLLQRWAEPHRSYHGRQHLAECTDALDRLASTSRSEALAVWFHDAVHSNAVGADERASATLARLELRAANLDQAEIDEVARLVLITQEHRPDPQDQAGARVSDADLAILGAASPRYRESVAQLRAEFATLTAVEWQQRRLARVEELLNAEPLFISPLGQRLWEPSARRNLTMERAELRDCLPMSGPR